MVNKTGEDMNQFDLDTGSGHIQYQIFTKDYTFKQDLTLTRSAAPRLNYVNSAGRRVERTINFTVDPQYSGATLSFQFNPDGKDLVWVEQADAEPKDTIEANTTDARRMYDRIAVGMSAEDMAPFMGNRPVDPVRYTWAKDFGWSLKPECVELAVHFVQGKVARVEITVPNGPRKGEIIAEKGKSRAELK